MTWEQTYWREGDDKENSDWYEPTGGQTIASVRWGACGIGRLGVLVHPVGGGLYGVHNLVMVEDEEGADDDDDEGDSVINCAKSTCEYRDGNGN